MKVVGIIAEYNPFHKGHEYQIEYAKRTLGADYVVVVMSGDFVQRGTPALLEKQVRARMALSGGANLVLELPVMWASASAEGFARGGVELLHALGVVDELCFGCESGTASDFLAVAEILAEEPAEFCQILQNGLKSGMSFPKARSHALQNYMAHSELTESPNNILGVEYCKALLAVSSPIRPVPLLRKGDGYHTERLSDSEYPSAHAIRSRLKEEIGACVTDAWEEDISRRDRSGDFCMSSWMNPESEVLLKEAVTKRRFLFEDCLDQPLHYALLSAIKQGELTSYQDMTAELANRITHTLTRYRGFSQYVELLKTKEITQTHIQRALLHVYLGLKGIPLSVPYARILGFRRASEELLTQMKKYCTIPLISKPADAKKLLDADAFSVFQDDSYCANLYESLLMAQQKNVSDRQFVHEYQKPVVIV